MTFDLGRRWLVSNAVTAGEVRHAVFDAVTRSRPFARALADASPAARGMLSRAIVEEGPRVSSVVPVREAMDKLPEGLAARLLAVPVHHDTRAEVWDVATVDPLDAHVASEVAFHLQAPVRLVAAPLEVIERAVESWNAVRIATANAPPITGDVREELVVPLVRRGRPSLPPVPQRGAPTPPVAMVFDFSAAAREERDAPATQRGAPPAPSRRPISVPKPPFRSIERVMAMIDRAVDRDEILDALIKGLLTTAGAAALLAQRKGQFVVLRDGGDYEPKDLPSKPVPVTGAVSEALRRGERIGHLDGLADTELLDALDLRYLGAVDVLMHAVSIADRPALLLVAFGIGDFAEASKRARLLATAASAGLTALLRR